MTDRMKWTLIGIAGFLVVGVVASLLIGASSGAPTPTSQVAAPTSPTTLAAQLVTTAPPTTTVPLATTRSYVQTDPTPSTLQFGFWPSYEAYMSEMDPLHEAWIGNNEYVQGLEGPPADASEGYSLAREWRTYLEIHKPPPAFSRSHGYLLEAFVLFEEAHTLLVESLADDDMTKLEAAKIKHQEGANALLSAHVFRLVDASIVGVTPES